MENERTLKVIEVTRPSICRHCDQQISKVLRTIYMGVTELYCLNEGCGVLLTSATKEDMTRIKQKKGE